MGKFSIPDLTFPMVEYSKNGIPWDLKRLLYLGGAGTNTRYVATQISHGTLGYPIHARLELVEKFHAELTSNIVGGRSKHSVKKLIRYLYNFYRWADDTGRTPTTNSLEHIFCEWTEFLRHRELIGQLKASAVLDFASALGTLINEVLDLSVPILRRTNIRSRKTKKRNIGAQADKQRLDDTFAFGHMLLDISLALNAEAIRGPLPIQVMLRTGQVVIEWAGIMAPYLLSQSPHLLVTSHELVTTKNGKRRILDANSLKNRDSLVHLRIEVEMLIFIAQTGINLAQVYKMKVGHFSYQSHLDGYLVRHVYKDRRQGEVAFEIYKEYRAHFERYLDWRKEMLPNADDTLFPLTSPHVRAAHVAPKLQATKKRCALLGIEFIGPRKLRVVRINWLLRRLNSPGMTAEMAQHTQETLFKNYYEPHHQVAIAQISRFHSTNDPFLAAPGPGVCANDSAAPVPDIPTEAPRPDCISPAGCLFCDHQRDIDSFDHVWSLVSYKFFKSLELVTYRANLHSAALHPTMLVIERITMKLEFLRQSEDKKRWITEAMTRIDEGHFHPKWDGFIQLVWDGK